MHRNSNHATELPVEVVERTASGTQEQRARRLFDEMARNIGREAVNHLKAMYPAALAAVPRAAELSLTNHIRNDINWRMRPLLMAMIAMHREWAEESAGGNDE